MTFPTVVFGSYEVGIGYTDGDSIPTGGLRVFIVPTKNVGPIPMDIGITYVDQFGFTKTTSVTTSVPAIATTGTHYEMVLNSGDTGIRDITDITIVGGTTGDKFNLESWNEGLGRAPYSIIRSDQYPQWTESDPMKNIVDFKRVFSLRGDFDQTIQMNIVQSGDPDAQLSLPIETIEPDYEFNINDFGLMRPITLISKDNNLKELRIELIPNQSYQYIDSNEQSARLKWKWDTGTLQYIDSGFYKLTFDYDVQFNSTYFIFELLNKDGTVVWNRTSTGTAINNVVLFKSLSWEFRLRCKANYTAPALTTDHAIIRNIRIEKYVYVGIAELNYSVDMPNIYRYESVDIISTLPVGTNSLLQLAFSDDDTTWSNWIGPDGTTSTYFEGLGQKVTTPLPLNRMGFYYKWILYLLSDGREAPILYDFTLYMKVKLAKEILSLETRYPYPYFSANPVIPKPIQFNKACPRVIPGYPIPPPGCTGGDFLPEPITGNEHIPKTYSYTSLCPRATPGYPTPPCIGGTFSGEPPSGRQLTARRLAFLKTWLESVVGQVVSGYVQNLSGDVIRNAFSMILMSTIPTEISPGGASIVSNVNPDTGLYQAFFKSIIYDKRYIIIKIGLKNVALEGAGVPPFIDGSQKLEIPYNLQFACPIIDCDFNITRKI